MIFWTLWFISGVVHYCSCIVTLFFLVLDWLFDRLMYIFSDGIFRCSLFPWQKNSLPPNRDKLDIQSYKMIKLGSNMKTSILIHTFFIIKPSCLMLYYYLIPSIENARVIWYILPGKDSSLYVFSANEFELNRIYTVPIQKVSFFFLFFIIFVLFFV